MVRLPACLTVALLGIAAAQPARAAYMWTGWEDVYATNETCITIGSEALKQIGFSTRISGQTVFGWLGDDGLSIRCLADRRIAVFFSYTQDEQNGRNFIEYIRLRLRATAPAPATPGAAAPALPPIPFGSSGASPGAPATPTPAAPSGNTPANRAPVTPAVPIPSAPVPNPPPPRTSPFADPSILTPGTSTGPVSTTPAPAAPLPSGPLTPVGPTGR